MNFYKTTLHNQQGIKNPEEFTKTKLKHKRAQLLCVIEIDSQDVRLRAIDSAQKYRDLRFVFISCIITGIHCIHDRA